MDVDEKNMLVIADVTPNTRKKIQYVLRLFDTWRRNRNLTKCSDSIPEKNIEDFTKEELNK